MSNKYGGVLGFCLKQMGKNFFWIPGLNKLKQKTLIINIIFLNYKITKWENDTNVLVILVPMFEPLTNSIKKTFNVWINNLNQYPL